MSEARALLIATAHRLFTDLRTRETTSSAGQYAWPVNVWEGVERVGLNDAARSIERGGSGASIADAAALLRVAGAFAVPIPLAETLLAEYALAAAGLPVRAGPLTVGPVIAGDRLVLGRKAGRWSVSGSLHRIAWGRDVSAVIAVADFEGVATTIAIERPAVERRGHNYAQEPRDDLRFDDRLLANSAVGKPGIGWTREMLQLRGALFRSLQMAGALEHVLELTVDYAKERVAFGRAIGKFQAVQQQIAVLATQVAAASAAAQAALAAATRGEARFEIAAAKARVGQAAGIAAGIAHQVHAAMGFTHEHSLHLSTRRLWSWRDEFGAEAHWFEWVGRTAAAVGGEQLWPFLTDTEGAKGIEGARHGPGPGAEKVMRG